jgi:hypothetical protein
MRSTRISVGAESRDGCMYSPYENKAGVANVVTEGRHRDLVGGNWDALGTLQFEFLLAQGLLPNSYLLDIGAGCLRGGVRYAEYLAPGHYFGVDAHQSLLDAGYDIELAAAGLRHKVPRSNLLASESFEFQVSACSSSRRAKRKTPAERTRPGLATYQLIRRAGELAAHCYSSITAASAIAWALSPRL